MKLSNTVVLSFAIAMSLSACVRGEGIVDKGPPRPMSAGTPRDAYAMQIERDVDASTVRAWEDASRRALRSRLSIASSFRERLRFPERETHAVAYRFDLRRGERIDLRVDEVDADGALFGDVFQVISDDMFRHVYAAPRNGTRIAFEAPADGEYVVRLQPRIGDGGEYDVTAASATTSYSASSSARFPVQGATMRSIGSVYGDPRDGGVRTHEGVDIFAARGTPVIAVADGRVTGVQETAVGGRVVWLTDADNGLLYYYAHLDTHLTHEGARVSAGETLGTVGNTGNASGSKPHLHFGVYRTGRVAVNPEPLLEQIGAPVLLRTSASVAAVDGEGLGRWMSVLGDNVRVRNAPSPDGDVVTQIAGDTRVLLLGNVAGWHRVVLADGTTGFVSSTLTTQTTHAATR